MQRDVARVLIDRRAIASRVEELARSITLDLAGPPHDPITADSIDHADITLVPILTGSIIFVADLIRHLPLRMQIRMTSVTSYPGTSTTSRGAKMRGDLCALPDSLAGAHVLVIDDILDSGQTLRLITEVIKAKGPASLRTCVLLRKQRPEAMAFPLDYVCFDIPDEFVVGYGLDYNGYYRNLPDIVTLTPEAVARQRVGETA